ncbi:MAG: chromate efflux transporter [Campylobacterales bacterium]|nr:chromate efflux transporter [Campylobacterales bacterium]
MRTLEIFWRFLLLGLSSFGGPVAHVGYFRLAFVERLGWLDEARFGRLLALCQFLPGPSSSQLGFAIGLLHGGFWGGLAAFVGFTLPSALLMLGFSLYVVGDSALIHGAIEGLKLLAVVVVFDALLGMGRSFAATTQTRAIALLSATTLWLFGGAAVQMGVLVGAALFGTLTLRSQAPSETQKEGSLGKIALVVFALLFVALDFIDERIAAPFYHAGSLVFGGGHVVLPLLQESVGEALSHERFMLGYALAQAVPGPMFSFATFLGAELAPDAPIFGALIATLGIFAPGFLLILAFGRSWERYSTMPRLSGALIGVNAAVVGILLAALYDPIFLSAVHSTQEMALAVLGYLALSSKKVPIVLLVLAFGLLGIINQSYM